MYFLEFIDIDKLPSMAIASKHEFPEIPCVYLVFDSTQRIYYVGGTKNLRKRWINHQKYAACSQLQNPRLAYLKVSPYLIWEAEAFLIRLLQPQFNIQTPSESELLNAQTL